MTKTPTEEAWESLATLVETKGAHWRLTDSPEDDCVDVPVADLRLAMADHARLQAERDRAVEALAEIADLGPATCEITLATTMAQLAAEAISTLPPPVKEAEPEPVALDKYDAGLLGDGGGGDVGWWHDYIRAELERAHEFLAQFPQPDRSTALNPKEGEADGR